MRVTIQIIIKDHAREFEVSEKILQTLKVGQLVKLDYLFTQLTYYDEDLEYYQQLLNDFEAMKSELTEPSLCIGQIREIEVLNIVAEWTQILIVEPFQFIESHFSKKSSEAKENLEEFFKSHKIIK